jgi:hypothetical protein
VSAAPRATHDFISPTESPSKAEIQAAHEERLANFPPTQPIDPKQVWATEKQVIETSRLFAQSPASATEPLPDEEREKLPATAVLVHYSELVKTMLEGSSDPDIDPDRPVWVTVVHGTIRNDSAMAGESIEDMTHDVFTTVYDAPSGDLVLYSSGGDAFAAGLPQKSTIEHNW